LGCSEMNPWHSRVKTEDYPDWCFIDLDPGKNSFNQVIEAAQVTRQILEGMGVTSYPKKADLPAFIFISRSVLPIPTTSRRNLPE